jgi:hypothetical protein
MRQPNSTNARSARIGDMGRELHQNPVWRRIDGMCWLGPDGDGVILHVYFEDALYSLSLYHDP